MLTFIYFESLVRLGVVNRSGGVSVSCSIILQVSLMNLSESLLIASLKVSFHFTGLLFKKRVPISCHCLAIVLSS